MDHIGGQAVIEGVMMRSPTKMAVSVRLPNKKIKTKKEKIKRLKIAKYPFIRGGFVLFDTLVKGTKTLLWSADQQLEKHEKITKKDVFWTLFITFAFVIGFFIVLPYALTHWIGVKEDTSPILFNFIDGLIKMALLLAYLGVISMFNDVKRVFQYHGAEHKAVNCFEAKKELTIRNAKKFPKEHSRCGTSFLIIVLVISILLFSLLPVLVSALGISLNFWLQRLLLLFLRILMLPIVAAVSFEVLKFGDRFKKFKLIGWITMPGIWVQKITTREPDNKQIEVAITALKSVK
ncbi:MAG: DUF1385 domain-containing protein [Candidatus Woesearchaeota archaeon]